MDMGYISRFFGTEEASGIQQDNEPLIGILKRGFHPSPSQVRQYRGEATVKPFILADAIYFTSKPRRTNENQVIHAANIEIRPTFWKLGFTNGPEVVPVIYAHDWPEDKSQGTLEGNYAILRLVTDQDVFGPRYGDALRLLTNFRSTLVEQTEDFLAKNSNVTIEDIIANLRNIRQSVGDSRNQIKAYEGIRSSVKRYQDSIPSFGWSNADQEEARELIENFLEVIIKLADDTIPNKAIRGQTEIYFENLISYLSDSKISDLDPNCQSRLGQNPIIHKLDHLQYGGEQGSYLNDIVDFTIENIGKTQLASAPALVKPQDSADNVRKEAEDTPYRHHMTYHKSLDVAKMGDRLLARLDKKHTEYNELYLAYKFLKGELFVRILGDYTTATSKRDRDFRAHSRWLQGQFRMVREYVGREIEDAMLEQLENALSDGDELEAHGAGSLLRAHRELIRLTSHRGKFSLAFF